MSERFFVEEPIASQTAKLVGHEAQHLAKVLRAKVGDEVTVFDGSGDEFSATVSAISRSEVQLDVTQRWHIDRELDFQLTMAVALPKGERQRWLVEKLTEVGVTLLVPLFTSRGVAQPVDQALVRLRRFVIEASKQCGRNRLMSIGEPKSCEVFFQSIPDNCKRLIAHPSSTSQLLHAPHDRSNVAVAIGPEGGFTDDEVSLAIDRGWQCMQLGKRILRVETAAITAAGMFSIL